MLTTASAWPLRVQKSTGWAVAILDVDESAAQAAANDIADPYGVPSLGVGTDVSDEESIAAAVDAVESSLPPVVGLVNLAGISSPTTFMEETREAWDKVFAVNMTGTFMVTQQLLISMIDRQLGRIVSVSSISAQRGGGTYSKVAYITAATYDINGGLQIS